MKKHAETIQRFLAAISAADCAKIADDAALRIRVGQPIVSGGGRASDRWVTYLIARNGVVLAQSRARMGRPQ